MIITFDNFQIYRPQIHENNGATKIMFPQEARLRNFTYSSAMTLDINIKIIKRSGEKMDKIETFIPKITKNSYRQASYYVEIKYLCIKTI